MWITRKICQLVLKVSGWTAECKVEVPQKCVFCVAPHTSNMDFWIAKIGYAALGQKRPNFLIKSDWFRFPFNLFFGPIGGIPVYRDKNDKNHKGSMVAQIIEEANKRDRFQLAITPEGTRSLNKKWKRGFYYIAKGANIPILVVALDFGRKQVYIDHVAQITEDADADIKAIQQWYVEHDIKGKYPEKFFIDEEDEA